MRRLASLLVLLASACDNGHPPQRLPHDVAQPTPKAQPPAAPLPAANEVTAAPATTDDAPAPNDPDLAGLSTAQRRAYELGYRDCAHGRYAPANHLEAYRIGCGAAHDRAEGGRPRG